MGPFFPFLFLTQHNFYHDIRQNKNLVVRLSKPDKDASELRFPSKYSLSFFGQFLACLWKQNLSYWRNPQYTAVRFFYTVIISLMFGTICWKFGSKRFLPQLLLFYTKVALTLSLFIIVFPNDLIRFCVHP